ncbi:Oidioi.mRNA.OKI2018_I69.PAR.g13032.t1.cds [Oikopleura dioica]|uniref:Oidioi.mRNA.OKI2018_I69.PAR.g13032.t1.cds n=1 Tax=Oikopleura dioica TaxID=34765 RepID=A0ABN7S8Y8_OIKDI|nr:Oidioi.mRNA.OKI2018_I69.PAR.g13032.t1.cds [Oikopleura dioica]
MTDDFEMNIPATTCGFSSTSNCDQQRAPHVPPLEMTDKEYIEKCEKLIGDGRKNFTPFLGYRLWKVTDGEDFFIPAATFAEIIKRKNLKVPRKLRDKIRSGESFDNYTIIINARDYNYFGSYPNKDKDLMLLRRELRSTTKMREEEENKAAERLLGVFGNESSESDNEDDKKSEVKK